MDKETFIKLHLKFSVKELYFKDINTKEYEEYIEAFNNDKELAEYYFQSHLDAVGYNKQDCCLEMSYHLSSILTSEKGVNDSDTIIFHNEELNEYGIPIHDGGSSYIVIKYCPWCGTTLK